MARILGLRSSLFLAFIGLALAFAGCGGSSAPPPHQASLLGSAVDGVVQAAMQQQGMPGMTVALSKNGTMLYLQGYGVSDLTTRQTTQPGTGTIQSLARKLGTCGNAIHTDRTLQIAVLGFDHLAEFSSSRLLCLKLESPVAMVFGFSLDLIRDDLSDKFIRRCLRILGKF
jgi:hypothetical protein